MADQSHKQAPPLPPSEDEITKASTGGADPHPTAIEDAGPSNEGGDTAGEGNELPLLPEDAGEPEEDIDPLILAQQEAERREKELAQAADIAQNDDPALKAFYGEMRDVDRENEVNRILGAFKINPFEQLGLRFTATDEQIRRQYRKVSLMVHPDKCPHPRAKDAFEIIGNAQKELLDPAKREQLDYLLNHTRDELRKELKKASKHDSAVRLAAMLHDSGKEGVMAAYEETDEFHEAWKTKARDILARAEWRKRKMTKRIAEEEVRAKEEHQVEKEEAKAKQQHDKAWEKTRDTRVGTWRDFMTKKSKKSKGGSAALGGLKPPKSKTSDGDRLYVQRPVGDQHRPPGK